MCALITFDRERMVHLDRGSYHWVSLKTFRIDSTRPDRALLHALVTHEQYRDHYAGDAVADQGTHALHGPYRLECINAETFHHTSTEAAHLLLHGWVRKAVGTPSRDVRKDLDQWVYPLFHADRVFQLPDLRPGAQHEWGWVVGGINGFHELVTINATEDLMTLIVASDD